MRAMALRISVGSVEGDIGLGGVRVEGEAHVGEGQVLEVEGAHRAGIAPVRFGAHQPDIERPPAFSTPATARRRRTLRFEDGDPRPAGHWRQDHR